MAEVRPSLKYDWLTSACVDVCVCVCVCVCVYSLNHNGLSISKFAHSTVWTDKIPKMYRGVCKVMPSGSIHAVLNYPAKERLRRQHWHNCCFIYSALLYQCHTVKQWGRCKPRPNYRVKIQRSCISKTHVFQTSKLRKQAKHFSKYSVKTSRQLFPFEYITVH